MIKKTLTSLFAVALVVTALSTNTPAASAQVIGPASFMSNLTVGSTGPEVANLQEYLSQRGFLIMPPGVAMGYFGQLTKQAVIKYQISQGIVPASGFVGPLTRGSINATLSSAPAVTPSLMIGCTSQTGFSTVTGEKCDGTVHDALQSGTTTPVTHATSTTKATTTSSTGSGSTNSKPTTSASVDNHGDASATDSTGEYTITFPLTGFGDVNYVPLTTARASTTDPSLAGVYYTLEDSNGNTVGDGTDSAVVTQVSGGSITTSGGISYIKLNEGQKAWVKLKVSFDPTADGFYRAQLTAINYKPDTAGTPTRQERPSPESTFQTDFANIQ